MKTYTITVKAVYMEEMTVLAEDDIAAEHIAITEFEPNPDSLFSIDVFGLSSWRPDSPLEDILRDQDVQRELDEKHN